MALGLVIASSLITRNKRIKEENEKKRMNEQIAELQRKVRRQTSKHRKYKEFESPFSESYLSESPVSESMQSSSRLRRRMSRMRSQTRRKR
jgi:hypothetical protein